MLLANKVAINYIPLPSVISFIQIVASCFIIFGLKLFGVQVDSLEWAKVKPYALYIGCFVGSIYTNMIALYYSNVETVIVFRACSPIAVTIIEYLFMDRAMISLRSAVSLSIVAVGAVAYCLSESQLSLDGPASLFWSFIYLILITIEMTYGKKLTSTVKMETVWGPVLYCNVLAALPMFLLGYVNGDYATAWPQLQALDFNALLVLGFSCITGTLIGYAR